MSLISEGELQKIIGEAERIHHERSRALDADQVRAILKDLDLPPELLEEAQRSLAARSKKARARRTLAVALGGSVGGLALIAAVAVLLVSRHQAAENAIVGASTVLGLVSEPDRPVDRFDRADGPVVTYRVTLKNVPSGHNLRMRCNWTDPLGKLAHQNRWRTRRTDHDGWVTHCRQRFTPTSQAGRWQVRMTLGERTMGEQHFELR